MRHDMRVLVLVMVLAMLLALPDVVVRSHATAAAVGALGFGVQQTEVLADTAKGDDVRRPTFMYRRESRFRRFLVFSGRSDDRTQECPHAQGLCFVDTHRPPGALPNTQSR